MKGVLRAHQKTRVIPKSKRKGLNGGGGGIDSSQSMRQRTSEHVVQRPFVIFGLKRQGRQSIYKIQKWFRNKRGWFSMIHLEWRRMDVIHYLRGDLGEAADGSHRQEGRKKERRKRSFLGSCYHSIRGERGREVLVWDILHSQFSPFSLFPL